MLFTNPSKSILVSQLAKKYGVGAKIPHNLLPISNSLIVPTAYLSKTTNKQLNIISNSTGLKDLDTSNIYNQFLNDFAGNGRKPLNIQFHKKSFTEINESSTEDITDMDRQPHLWSSEYDPVSRSPFARDVSHLQSLLDALITSKTFDRADNILMVLYRLMGDSQQFLFSFNTYLEAWSLDENVTIQDIEEFIGKYETKFSNSFKNDRTFAILISRCISLEDSRLDHYMDVIQSDVVLSRKVFNHIDVFGVDNLMQIFQHNSVSRSQVPLDLLTIYEESQEVKKSEALKKITNETFNSESPESSPLQTEQHETTASTTALNNNESNDNNEIPETSQFNEKSVAPSLDKDVSLLKPVDSYGIKIIRYNLLGLKSKRVHPKLEEFIDSLGSNSDAVNLYQNEKDKIDFFEIQKSLSNEDKIKFNELLEEYNDIRERQLEAYGVDAAKEKWKHEYEEILKRGTLSLDKNLNAQIFKWYQDLLPYVEEEVALCKKLVNGEVDYEVLTKGEKQEMDKRSFYAPYFILVAPEKMCAMTILELLKLNGSGGIADGMRLARALLSVGKAIECEHHSQSLIEQEGRSFSKKKNVQDWKKLLRARTYKGKVESMDQWNDEVTLEVGSILTSYLIHSAKVRVVGTDPTNGKTITGEQPAFHHSYQYLNGQRIGVIKIHKKIIHQLSGKAYNGTIQPQLLPMLSKPRPWKSHSGGGYLYSQNSLVRFKESAEILAYLKAAADSGNLDRIYQGLNVLGETAWTINRKVFNVLSHYWNTEKRFLDIPPVESERELPDPVPFNAEPAEKNKYQRQLKSVLADNAAVKSLRCSHNYTLEIGRAFIGEKLYFPHNLDFRGRAYPLSPNFNHLGGDFTRSLFLFWDGKEIGERGLEWLKIHMANVYGIDKAPLKDRIKFVEDNLDIIKACAEDPIGHEDWWTKGEKPWQVLSMCFEIAEAHKLEDPTKYVSHMPIHQDGTCNGLQHYAALGGDIEGARQVNLLPAEKPQDVYTYVSNLVQKRVDSDAKDGHKIALFMQDKITRKVVKQTVMTNVYGVTFVGAVSQVRRQINKHFDKDQDDEAQKTAAYIALLVLASVRELFHGAHLIQDWLGECAKRISKSVSIDYDEKVNTNKNKPNHLSSVIWTTPLGLPCVQPYRAASAKIISTNLQDVTITDPFISSQVDARKQQTAFTPNFVHSLDATHMLMTAKACGDLGLSFASVHDSYWTHACDVDAMSEQLRKKFVELHGDDLVAKLKEEFEARYKGSLQVSKIPSNHEVLAKIRMVKRKIVKQLGRALTVADEIYLEKRRQELLNSKKPEMVELGKKMETTVSVTEGYDFYTSEKTKGHTVQILTHLKFPEIPSKGEFNVQDVEKSTYFFS